jgi:hypothetical protein
MVKSRLSRRIFCSFRLRPGRSEENFQFHPARGTGEEVGAYEAKEAKGFRLIFGYSGIFLMFEGLVTILPLADFGFLSGRMVVALGFRDSPVWWGLSWELLFFFGLIAGRPKGHFARNDDALAFGFALAFAVVLGSLPLLFHRDSPSILGIAMSLWE